MKKVLKVLVMIILTIILFTESLILLNLIPLRETINNKIIKDAVVSLDFEKIIEDNPQLEEELNKSLEPIYEVTREVGLKDEIVLKILNIKEVKEIMGNVLDNLVVSVVTTQEQKLLDNADLQKVISDAIDDINATKLYEIKPETKAKILNAVNETYLELQDLIPQTNLILDNLPTEYQPILNTIHLIFSNQFLYFNIIIVVLSLLFIILLNLDHFKWLKISSLICLVATVINFVIASLLYYINSTIIFKGHNYLYTILLKFINCDFLISIYLIVILIILLIIYRLINRKLKNKEVTN